MDKYKIMSRQHGKNRYCRFAVGQRLLTNIVLVIYSRQEAALAKQYKHAGKICFVLTIIAALGIILGIVLRNPLITLSGLFPTVVYEVYRTEGKSTKWASWVLLAALVLECLFIAMNVRFDLASYFGLTGKYVAGYWVLFGDIKVVGPALMAVLSIILFVRTRGVYTKWLAVVIFMTCFALVYTLNPTAFNQLLHLGVEEGIRRINFRFTVPFFC